MSIKKTILFKFMVKHRGWELFAAAGTFIMRFLLYIKPDICMILTDNTHIKILLLQNSKNCL